MARLLPCSSNSLVMSGWTRVICSEGYIEMFFTNFPLDSSPDISHSWEKRSPCLLALLAWSEKNKTNIKAER